MIVTIILILIIVVFVFILISQQIRNSKELLLKDQAIITARQDAVAKSKAVTRGKISEEFIPLFPDFPYNMSDCKFSGSPIDFIVFNGMSEFRDNGTGEIQIIFADVKVNTAQRNKVQNAIKKAVENKNIKFETWKIDENKKINIK